MKIKFKNKPYRISKKTAKKILAMIDLALSEPYLINKESPIVSALNGVGIPVKNLKESIEAANYFV
jgi:hypothetical protein